MEEYFYRNKKYFDKIFTAYDELIARVSDDPEYIQNYLKVLENIRTYHLDAQKLEDEPVLVERIVQNYGRLFELVPGNLELFKKLQVLTEQFKNYCILSRNFEAANRVFGQIEEIYSGILKKEPGHMLISAHLLFLYETSADLYAKLGKIRKAEESYLRALDYLAEKQRASPGNTTYVRQQGEVY